MARTRSRDTKPELAVRAAAHARGLRFFVDRAPIAGLRRRADLLFPRLKLAVFVDGCFFHHCPEHGTWPKRNARFWREKIEANVRRDAQTNQILEANGWTVLRFWEHEDPGRCAAAMERAIAHRRRSIG